MSVAETIRANRALRKARAEAERRKQDEAAAEAVRRAAEAVRRAAEKKPAPAKRTRRGRKAQQS